MVINYTSLLSYVLVFVSFSAQFCSYVSPLVDTAWLSRYCFKASSFLALLSIFVFNQFVTSVFAHVYLDAELQRNSNRLVKLLQSSRPDKFHMKMNHVTA